MKEPIALKLDGNSVQAFRISLDRSAGEKFGGGANNLPALIITRTLSTTGDGGVGVIDAATTVVVNEGDWSDALLVVLPEVSKISQHDEDAVVTLGDIQFLDRVSRDAPPLLNLAKETIQAIRRAGITGQLREATGGRWVNHPINSFTLKCQPRAGNFQFTLYGNPETYDAAEFLRKDQNSYSRGWVRSHGDITKFVKFAHLAHSRRGG